MKNKFAIGAYFLKILSCVYCGMCVCVCVCVCRTIKTMQQYCTTRTRTRTDTHTQIQLEIYIDSRQHIARGCLEEGMQRRGRERGQSSAEWFALVNGNQRKSSIEHRTRIGNQQLLMVHGECRGE